jgi:hypothetical protein
LVEACLVDDGAVSDDADAPVLTFPHARGVPVLAADSFTATLRNVGLLPTDTVAAPSGRVTASLMADTPLGIQPDMGSFWSSPFGTRGGWGSVAAALSKMIGITAFRAGAVSGTVSSLAGGSVIGTINRLGTFGVTSYQVSFILAPSALGGSGLVTFQATVTQVQTGAAARVTLSYAVTQGTFLGQQAAARAATVAAPPAQLLLVSVRAGSSPSTIPAGACTALQTGALPPAVKVSSSVSPSR